MREHNTERDRERERERERERRGGEREEKLSVRLFLWTRGAKIIFVQGEVDM